MVSSSSESDVVTETESKIPGNSSSTAKKLKKRKNIEPIGIRLPPFWHKSISTWFAQVEAQFKVSRIISDTTKLNYVIAALPQDVAESIIDILDNPPENNSYANLKETLISRHSVSAERKIKQLISDEEMGDRKPSEFYRYLGQLAGPVSSAKDDEFIKKLWLGRLPHLINIALIPQSEKTISILLQTADKLWDAMQANNVAVHSISEYSHAGTSSQHDEKIKKIKKLELEIDELKQQMSKMRFSNRASRSPFRGYPRNQSRSRSLSRKRFNPTGSLCWYHFKYGNNARKCTAPCSNGKKNESSSSTTSLNQ